MMLSRISARHQRTPTELEEEDQKETEETTKTTKWAFEKRRDRRIEEEMMYFMRECIQNVANITTRHHPHIPIVHHPVSNSTEKEVLLHPVLQ